MQNTWNGTPPVATPVTQAPPPMQKMAVTVPPGVSGGMKIQVQTPAGLMEVSVPEGLGPGAYFEMMVPTPRAEAQAIQQPPVAQAQPVQPTMQQAPMAQGDQEARAQVSSSLQASC